MIGKLVYDSADGSIAGLKKLKEGDSIVLETELGESKVKFVSLTLYHGKITGSLRLFVTNAEKDFLDPAPLYDAFIGQTDKPQFEIEFPLTGASKSLKIYKEWIVSPSGTSP
jgi:hypothetical protein